MKRACKQQTCLYFSCTLTSIPKLTEMPLCTQTETETETVTETQTETATETQIQVSTVVQKQYITVAKSCSGGGGYSGESTNFCTTFHHLPFITYKYSTVLYCFEEGGVNQGAM